MRFLHTADLHMLEQLRSIDRQPDIVARTEEIATYLEQNQVDVLGIAGDLFSQCSRMEELERAVKEINRIFKAYLLKGGTIIVLSGNHDNDFFFSILRSVIDLAVPLNPQQTGPRPPGRLYLAAQPTLLELEDRKGTHVQFVLLPYPTSRRYLKDEQTRYKSLTEKYDFLHKALMHQLEIIMAKLNPHIRSVLMAHLYVRGAQLHNLYHPSEATEIVYSLAELPTFWDYIALGHVHRPQGLEGYAHVRYAGSVEHLHRGDHEEKSVVQVDIGPQGRLEEPQILKLHATPFYHIEICDPERDLPALREKYPERERALVSYHLIYRPGEHDPQRIAQELHTIFPRIYEQQEEREGNLSLAENHLSTEDLRHVPETVERYIQERLGENPDREAILALARDLLAHLEEDV